MSAIIYGTTHFDSLRAAIAYYRPYGYEDVKATVNRKIAEGEIYIGVKPTLKPGQRFQWGRDGRGMITELRPAQAAKA